MLITSNTALPLLGTLGLVATFALSACNSTLHTEATTNTNNMSQTNPTYVFTATVVSTEQVTLGQGGASGKGQVTRISGLVQYVARGSELKPAQPILIELAANQTRPALKSTCQFVAPHKHPAFEGKTLILQAEVMGCNP